MDESNKTIHSGFFAVIPATVLLCDKIPANAKLLFGVISSLCLKEGFCWASNKYLAEQMGLKPDTISDLIQDLTLHNFVNTYYGDEKYDRCIYLGTGMIPSPPGSNTPSHPSTYTRGGECKDRTPRVRTPEGVSTYTLAINKDDNTSDNTKKKILVDQARSPVDDTSSVLAPKLDFKKRWDKDSLEYQLAECLITLIVKRENKKYDRYLTTEEGREAVLQKQAYHFDKILRLDRRPPDELIEILQWSQEDEFWQKNILSAEKLRHQYDQLKFRMTEKGYGSFVEDPNEELTADLIGVFRALSHNPDFMPTPVQHQKFMRGSVQMRQFFQHTGIPERDWSDYVLECFEKNYTNRGETLYPGHFCSNNTWEILMPQYAHEVRAC